MNRSYALLAGFLIVTVTLLVYPFSVSSAQQGPWKKRGPSVYKGHGGGAKKRFSRHEARQGFRKGRGGPSRNAFGKQREKRRWIKRKRKQMRAKYKRQRARLKKQRARLKRERARLKRKRAALRAARSRHPNRPIIERHYHESEPSGPTLGEILYGVNTAINLFNQFSRGYGGAHGYNYYNYQDYTPYNSPYYGYGN
jgi:hypothetical protein